MQIRNINKLSVNLEDLPLHLALKRNFFLNQFTVNELEDAVKALKNRKDNPDEFCNQDVVLVMGPSGSSKNTFVSYMLSQEMKVTYHFLKDYIDVNVSKEDKVRTLPYPKLYHGKNQVAFANCTPFYTNDSFRKPSFSKALCQSIAFEEALVNAKSIRGIFFVLDADLFNILGGKYTNMLLENIECLLHYAKELSESITFIVPISNPTSLSMDMIREKLDKIIDGFMDSDEDAGENKSVSWLQLLKEKVMLVNYLDQGESRDMLYRIIDTAKQVPLSQFNFVTHANNHDVLNNMPQAILELVELTNELNIYEQQIKTQLAENEAQMKLLNDRYLYLKVVEDTFDINQAEHKVTANKIIELNTKVILLTKKEEIQNQLDELDNDELVVYWEDSIHEERGSLLGLGFLGVTKKHFYHTGLPFDDIYIDCPNGMMTNQLIDSANGTFSADYESKRGCLGDATVKIFLKKKNLPINKINIELYKKQLRNVEVALLFEELDKNKLIEELAELERKLETIENLNIEYETKLKEMNNEKNALESTIDLYKKTNRALEEVTSQLTEAETQLSLFEPYIAIIKNNHAILMLNESIILRINDALEKHTELTSSKNALPNAANVSTKADSAMSDAALLQQHGLHRPLQNESSTLPRPAAANPAIATLQKN